MAVGLRLEDGDRREGVGDTELDVDPVRMRLREGVGAVRDPEPL